MSHSHWKTLPLTANQRPVLYSAAGAKSRSSSSEPAPVEIELMIEPKVHLYTSAEATKLRDGTCTLTTHRVLWISKDHQTALFLPLPLVSSFEKKSSAFSAAKIVLYIHPDPKSGGQPQTILSFHNKGRDAFYVRLKEAMNQKLWAEVNKKAATPKQFSTHGAGIDGIIRARKLREQQEDKSIDSAFKDLGALMTHAKEIVAIAKKVSDKVEAANKTKPDDEKTKVDKEFQEMLSTMGIPSPVTRASAGTAYHTELSRQLADFIKRPLDKRGGMMTLTDVYCIFNRARGTELISPEDLVHACELLDANPGSGLKIRRFDSGVKVLQSMSLSDESFRRRLLEFLEKAANKGMSALQVSKTMNCSFTLAKEHCLNGEKHMMLCRDESVEGLKFFPMGPFAFR